MLNVNLKNSEDLLKVFRSVENILSYNKVENKLKYVKLSNEKGVLKITARNPFMRLEYKTYVNAIEGSVALYDYKTIASLLNVIEGNVHINDRSIKSDKCSYNIPCIDGDGYPDDELPDIANYYKLNTQEFKEALNNVSVATDKLGLYAIMTGVYIGENKLLASDSKRVFMQNLTIDSEFNGVVLPKEIVNEVPRLPFGQDVYITLFGNNIIIKDENITITCTKTSDSYPKVEELLPKEINNQIIINKEELQNALTMIAPIMDNDVRYCILEYQNDCINVKADNGLNKAKTTINAEIKNKLNEPIVVKFNIQFLMDMLKANGDKIKIDTYSDNIGYMFSSNNSKQYIIPLIN